MKNSKMIEAELAALEALEEIAATTNVYVSFQNIAEDENLFLLIEAGYNAHVKNLFPKPMPKAEIFRICDKHLMGYCILKYAPRYDDMGELIGGIIQPTLLWRN